MKRSFFLPWAALLTAVCALNAQCTKDDENIGGGGGGGETHYIYYENFGAVGDGVTDDFNAIVEAHKMANQMGWTVKGKSGAKYYIGDVETGKTAVIKSNVDWTGAEFIIDDTKVSYTLGTNSSGEPIISSGNYGVHIFTVSPTHDSWSVASGDRFAPKKSMTKIPLNLGYPAVIVATNSGKKQYIRTGSNVNDGSNQTDVFVVDANGNVDMSAPIIWDFDKTTSMTVHRIDETTITIKGGKFTTIANDVPADRRTYPYYGRNIYVERSNVVIDGLEHRIDPSEENRTKIAPYNGFIYPANCTNVTVQNCKLSGRKIHSKPSAANPSSPVNMGSYGLGASRAINFTVRDCEQINDIYDETRWGLFASNFCKNIVFDNVSFSRFDAHQGVTNVTVKNSVLGHQGFNLIGFGTCLIENTDIHSAYIVNLRSDYGSTFNGDVIINNCRYYPKSKGTGVATTRPILINGSNDGSHDYGYDCYMPTTITIRNLYIDDTHSSAPVIFNSFGNYKYKETDKSPYHITEQVIVDGYTTKNGKMLTKAVSTSGSTKDVPTTGL